MRISVLLLLALVPVTHGCSCLFRTNQEKYCDAEFSALVYVFGEESSTPGVERVYNTYAIEFYKPLNTFRIDRTRVYTAFDSAACGVSLPPGLYVLSGEVESLGFFFFFRRRMVINLCGLNEQVCAWSKDDLNIDMRGDCPNIPSDDIVRPFF